MNNQPQKDNQSLFDRAFVDVIQFLVTNKKYIQKITTQKELLKELDILPGNFVEIRNGSRKVPNSKVEHIKRILTTKYGVSEKYLKFREGEITKAPINYQDDESRQTMSLREENRMLKLELQKEKELSAQKDEMINLLKSTLDTIRPKA